jgi:lysophospholipase L1-like esterase
VILLLLACTRTLPESALEAVDSPVDSPGDSTMDTQDTAADWPVWTDDACSSLPPDPGYGDTVALWTAQDVLAQPTSGQLVATGSSSIRRWETAQSALSSYGVIQRGFGGAELWEVAHHAEDLVLRHKPAAVLVYAGTNDLSAGRTPEQVVEYTRCLAYTVWTLGQVPVFWVGITPNPARWPDWERAAQTNGMVQELAQTHPGLHYIDTAGPFLETGAPPQADLFDADQLHLSPAGYQLWDAAIESALEGVLTPRSPPENPLHPASGALIRVDLGPSNPEDGDRAGVDDFGIQWNAWHPVDGNAQILAGEHLDGLLSTQGLSTGVHLVISGGFRCNGKLNGGLTEPDGALLGTLAVPQATSDYFYTDGGDNPGAISWQGLDPQAEYTLRLFASRDSEEHRSTRYSVDGQSLVLQTSGLGAGTNSTGNNDTVMVFSDLAPDAWGALHLDVEIESGSYAYLSLMELEVQ